MAKFFFAVEIAWGVMVSLAVIGFVAISFIPECTGACRAPDAGVYATHLESLDGLTVASMR